MVLRACKFLIFYTEIHFQGVLFDIIAILNANSAEGAKIVDKYQHSGLPICNLDRNVILKLGLSYLVSKFGFYPDPSVKENLAEAIVKAFPQMALHRAGMKSHAYLYNQATANAFIDQHLKRMRTTNLDKDERKRKSNVAKTPNEADPSAVNTKGKSLKKKACLAVPPLPDSLIEDSKTKVN